MKLSIITINYNNLEGLKKTYESIVSQTWTDYEWIIIDGGSTDGSREFIEEHQEKFAYWCSESDKGIFNALNKGVTKANGQYVNFLNTGDVYTSKNVLHDIFEGKDYACDVIYGDWQDVVDGQPRQRWSSGSPLTLKQELTQCTCHQALFISPNLLRELPYDESYKMMADWRNNIIWMIQGKTFEHTPVLVCYYDLTGVSSNFESEAYKSEKKRMLDEIFPPMLKPFYENVMYDKALVSENPILNETKRVLELRRKFSIPISLLLKFLVFIDRVYRKIYK